jgi:branched-subunit amino acid transport protein
MTTGEAVLTMFGVALLTLLTRSFFLLPERELPMPAWLKQGLRYAPLAALVAVVVPEIALSQGELIATWKDPRLPAVAVATAYYFWRATSSARSSRAPRCCSPRGSALAGSRASVESFA